MYKACHPDLWNFYGSSDGKTYIRLFSEKTRNIPGRIGLTPELLADFIEDITRYANDGILPNQAAQKQVEVGSRP